MSKGIDTTALEHEIEETRERLAGTIDQLLHRSSPKTIAARQTAAIKAHYVDPATGEPRTGNVLRTVGALAGVVAVVVVLRKVTR